MHGDCCRGEKKFWRGLGPAFLFLGNIGCWASKLKNRSELVLWPVCSVYAWAKFPLHVFKVKVWWGFCSVYLTRDIPDAGSPPKKMSLYACACAGLLTQASEMAGCDQYCVVWRNPCLKRSRSAKNWGASGRVSSARTGWGFFPQLGSAWWRSACTGPVAR